MPDYYRATRIETYGPYLRSTDDHSLESDSVIPVSFAARCSRTLTEDG